MLRYAKIMDNSNNHDNNSSFWKSNSRAVPGRPSPKKELTKLPSSKSGKNNVSTSSFQDYQQSVSDAWDLGDDEFCIISGIADTKISKKVSQSAALNVIQTHRSNMNSTNNFSSIKNEKQVPKITTAITSVTSSTKTTTTTTTVTSSKSLSSSSSSPLNDSTEKENTASSNVKENNQSSKNCRLSTNSIENDIMSSNNEISYENSRTKYRQFHAYPGRPHLQKFSSISSLDSEYESKIEKFSALLEANLLDLVALKKLSWSGIPKKMRAISWRLLSEYLPTCLERRSTVLERKRLDYHNLVAQYFKVDSKDETQQDTYRQIHIDVPRMNPHVPLFQQKLVQEMFERILFIWAIRHPASGYVQGINDLVTPFFIVFLQDCLSPGYDLEAFNLESLSIDKRNAIEADSFWCLSKFLDCIQDNYIFAQLGIQSKVNQLKDLIQRIDGTLHRHLQTQGVDYLQFSFRWMNNLLTRELPLHCTIRLWDTYLAESDGFAVFHLYVCAAFLLHWRDQLLQQKDFQGLMLLLQNLPTHNWTDRQISVLVAEAFKLKFTYADAPKHLEGKS